MEMGLPAFNNLYSLSVTAYDIGIVGGGLAGLSLAIQAAESGYSVVLVEKETYPFHKVCGEYISLESWPFLQNLGVPLTDLGLPVIKKLTVSSPNGNFLQHYLPQGGFGISRYTLDNLLKEIAIKKGATIIENCKAEDIVFSGDYFTVKTNAGPVTCTVCCGSFGKRSNIDIKWNRNFVQQKPNSLNNYIGVKYHVKINFPNDEIALHNFKDGYCGISKIEDGLCCLCYLTTAGNLKKGNNSIADMEALILHKNPFLKNIFMQADIMYSKPVTISQISFAKKTQVENHVLLIGDAAGMITPLCGNGMSMALHGSKLAFAKADQFLKKEINRGEMELGYAREWKNQFSVRVTAGRNIQRFFGKEWVTNAFLSIIKKSPWAITRLIKLTHGKPF
jgi:menaquinone-9 beta-reductase